MSHLIIYLLFLIRYYKIKINFNEKKNLITNKIQYLSRDTNFSTESLISNSNLRTKIYGLSC